MGVGGPVDTSVIDRRMDEHRMMSKRVPQLQFDLPIAGGLGWIQLGVVQWSAGETQVFLFG